MTSAARLDSTRDWITDGLPAFFSGPYEPTHPGDVIIRPLPRGGEHDRRERR